MPGFLIDGVMSAEEVRENPNYPSEARLARGPAVVIECIQEIPCNPCEDACPYQAIRVGRPIVRSPRVDYEKCTGCGLCLSCCPGMAIFLLAKPEGKERYQVTLPYELLPLPRKGELVVLLDRRGAEVGKGRVLRVSQRKANNLTPLITVEAGRAAAREVRNIRLQPAEAPHD